MPLKAKSALQLAYALRSELKAAKPEFADWSEAKRTIFCKGIIEQLREAWDQGIADFVFPVLGRFNNAIKGASLFRLAVLTDDDVKTVTAARGRLSEELHFTAETLNPESVAREELVDEVGKLEVWLSDINQRQKAKRMMRFAAAVQNSIWTLSADVRTRVFLRSPIWGRAAIAVGRTSNWPTNG